MAHPENRYIQKINRLLRPLKQQHRFYYAKIQMAGNNGWPDCYYSGPGGDLWAEYKYISDREFPKKSDTNITVKLSKNQQQWIAGRHQEGRNVCVIVGSPHGSVLLRWPIPKTISRADFIQYAVEDNQIAQYIKKEVMKNDD